MMCFEDDSKRSIVIYKAECPEFETVWCKAHSFDGCAGAGWEPFRAQPTQNTRISG